MGRDDVLARRGVSAGEAVYVNAPFELPEIETNSPLVHALFTLLLTDDPDAMHRLQSLNFAKTLLGSSKASLLQEVRFTFQRLLKSLFSKFKELRQEDIFWAEALVGNLLSYFTFFAPQENETLFVPIYFNDKWQLPEYKIEKIKLTPRQFGPPALAFGLKSLTGPPLLLFKGTAYPTDQGFILQVFTDINPCACVGGYLFYFGKEALSQWLQNAQGKAQVYGLSLGGALALLAAVHFYQFIDKVFAYNAPALLRYDVKKWDRLDAKGIELPHVMVFLNERDIVPHSGFARGANWKVYKVLSGFPENFPTTHLRCYLGRKEHIVKKMDPKDKGFCSQVVGFCHQWLSLPLFILGILIYFPLYWIRSKREKS